MKIEFFDNIDFNRLEDYYETEVKIDSNEFELDLNFETEDISSEDIAKLASTLKSLPSLISKTWDWIIADYNDGFEVKEYISFHLNDMFEDDPEEILEGTNSSLTNDKRFLEKLSLKRVGIYPTSYDYIVFDYMIDEELSDYILAINLNEDLELEYISMES